MKSEEAFSYRRDHHPFSAEAIFLLRASPIVIGDKFWIG